MASNEQLGSVGTLIGAAMETAGHHVQSQLLDVMNGGGLGDSLGGLLFLIAISTGVIVTAIGGSYRTARWLLIGPVLFWFLVAKRVPSEGAEWRFGERSQGLEEVHRANRGVIDGNSAGQVSYFFMVWNKIVSDIVQDLVKLAYLTQKDYDLDFLNKSERYGRSFRDTIKDSRLDGFVQLTMVNKCRYYYYLVWRVNDPDVLEAEKAGAKDVLKNWPKDEKVFNRDEPDGAWFDDWLKVVTQGAGVGALGDQRKYSCPELWKLMVALVKKIEVEPFLEMLVSFNVPEGMDRGEIRSRLLKKYAQRIQAGERVAESDQAIASLLINEATARVMMKALGTVRPMMAQWNMNEHPQAIPGEAGRMTDQDTSRALRMLQKADQYLHKGELIAGSLTMPYVQGMLLYFLAMSFPFFAILTIVPGRHTAMLTWMSLWVWAKMWDFGFAVVMMIDNLLYALLPHGPRFDDATVNDPALAIKKIFESDPTYSLHTYYNVLSCCLFAVPVVTGFLVHKGGSELVSAVQEGWREFPTAVGNSMASYERAMMVQSNLAQIHQFIHNETIKAAWGSFVHDKEIQSELINMLRNSAGVDAARTAQSILGSTLSDGSKVEELVKRLGNRIQPVLESAMRMESQRSGQIVLAKLRANMSMAAYRASYSDFAVELASDSVAIGWNSHDAGMDVPIADLMMVEQAREWRPTGMFYDTALTQTYRSVFGDESVPDNPNRPGW